MGVPRIYPGMMQHMAFNNVTLEEVLDIHVAAVATQLRNKLDPRDLGHTSRMIMTLMNHHLHTLALTILSEYLGLLLIMRSTH